MNVTSVHATGTVVLIEASTSDRPAACPACGTASARVHSRYQRRLSDTAIADREVLIRLRVRRLFCSNTDCARTTFAEQIPDLAGRHARRTAVLQRVFGAVGLALGGRAGARLTRHLAASISRMTLLRIVAAYPTRTGPPPGSWALTTSPCAAATTTAPCWSTSSHTARSTCSPTAPPRH